MTRLLIILPIFLLLTGCVNRTAAPEDIDMSNVLFATPIPEEGALPGVPITNELLIKKALAVRLNIPLDNLELTITADENEYAAGQVRIIDANRQLRWYAVREKGGWQIISARTTLIRCSELEAYPDFPTTLVPQCLTDQGQTVSR
jgi:hypothetical protein